MVPATGTQWNDHRVLAELRCNRQDLVDQPQHLLDAAQVALAVRLGMRHLGDHLMHVHAHYGVGVDQLLELGEHGMRWDLDFVGLRPLAVTGKP
jgi:hypothetical protein